MTTEYKSTLSSWQTYDKWIKEFKKDMDKHYSDKRRIIKKRFCK